MKNIRTKRRKPKRFEWEKTEATCVFIVTGNTWYMRQVNCWVLGDWAYHWLYNGWFSIFHKNSMSLLGHTPFEKKARSFIKKLNSTMEPLPKNHVDLIIWYEKIKSTVDLGSLETNLPEDVTYNPEEDIPF